MSLDEGRRLLSRTGSRGGPCVCARDGVAGAVSHHLLPLPRSDFYSQLETFGCYDTSRERPFCLPYIVFPDYTVSSSTLCTLVCTSERTWSGVRVVRQHDRKIKNERCERVHALSHRTNYQKDRASPRW